jgi:hypothetical protein
MAQFCLKSIFNKGRRIKYDIETLRAPPAPKEYHFVHFQRVLIAPSFQSHLQDRESTFGKKFGPASIKGGFSFL